MGYTGPYTCPVAGCGFAVNVTENRYVRQGENQPKKVVVGTASSGRETVVAHGQDEHNLNWTSVGNQVFIAPVAEVEPLAGGVNG
jgi:hypothetical protein